MGEGDPEEATLDIAVPADNDNNLQHNYRDHGIEFVMDIYYFKSPVRLNLISNNDRIFAPEKPHFKYFMVCDENYNDRVEPCQANVTRIDDYFSNSQ